jgi:hypothetical protein
MEDIGAEGDERWERGVGWGEGDMEAEDGGGVRSCCISSVRVRNVRLVEDMERIATLPYEYYARPECWVAGSEAHEYAMRAGVLETRAVPLS